MIKAKKLRARWSIEAYRDIWRNLGVLGQIGVEYDYISPVRWWQFWRWHLISREDYVLSRADEFLTVCVIVPHLREAMEGAMSEENMRFLKCLKEGQEEILRNTALECPCGWKGLVKDTGTNTSGIRICPDCGGTPEMWETVDRDVLRHLLDQDWD